MLAYRKTGMVGPADLAQDCKNNILAESAAAKAPIDTIGEFKAPAAPYRGWHVILTVADHDQNGFIGLARWNFSNEQDARSFVSGVDGLVDDDSEPDCADANFWFLLDIHKGAHNLLDEGVRRLPLQVAMKLAQKQVQSWLEARPDPDAVYRNLPPVLQDHNGAPVIGGAE